MFLEFLETNWSQILIGIILSALVFAFIFSQKFRQDVVGGEGQATIFGLISVQGVIIVLLCGILVGAILWLEPPKKGKQESIDGFIKELPERVKKKSHNKTRHEIRKVVEQVYKLRSKNDSLKKELHDYLDNLEIEFDEYD